MINRSCCHMSVSASEGESLQTRQIFTHTSWLIFGAQSCRRIGDSLPQNHIGVVLGNANLPDGGWTGPLDLLLRRPAFSPTIVTDEDDSTGAGAVDLGAHRSVSDPFDCAAVTGITGLPWLKSEWSVESCVSDVQDDQL